MESSAPSPFLSDFKALSTDMTTDSSEECGGKSTEPSSENKVHERERESAALGLSIHGATDEKMGKQES